MFNSDGLLLAWDTQDSDSDRHNKLFGSIGMRSMFDAKLSRFISHTLEQASAWTNATSARILMRFTIMQP